MPKPRRSPVDRSKNPVTLLDYLSFGVGALGGFIASHHIAHLDGGYSVTAGGFAAMGATRAATLSLSGRFVRRRLTKRADALSKLLEAPPPNLDLRDRLQMVRQDWEDRDSVVVSDDQFDAEMDDIADTFRKRRYPKPRRLPLGPP